MRVWTINLILVLMLAGCSSVPVNSVVENTPTSTPTITVSPTITPSLTPTIEPPTIPHGLRPENAATQVVENGMWVVKSSDGKVTATWNKETKTWIYSAENIKTEFQILGFEGQDPSLLNSILRKPLPPEDPATSFIVSKDGQEVRYGLYGEYFVESNNSITGKFTYLITEVLVRIRGALEVSGVVNFVYELPRTHDVSIILVEQVDQAVWIMHTNVQSLVENPASCNQCVGIDKRYPKETYIEVISTMVGRQASISICHGYPENVTEAIEVYKLFERLSQQLLSFINDPSAPRPVFPYGTPQGMKWFASYGFTIYTPGDGV